MTFPLNASATVVVVKGYWWADDGSGVPRTVTATPAVDHVVSVSGKGVIDLAEKSVTPDGDNPYWEIEVLASDDPDITPACPWTFRFAGYDGEWAVTVPHDAVTGTDGRPEVWLTSLTPLVNIPEPQTTDYFYTKDQIDALLAAHLGMANPGWDPHPQYALDGDPQPPTGGAGGVLSGQFPNPGFAVDMATQAELDANSAADRARANHTGAQTISTVTNLQTTLDAKARTADVQVFTTVGSFTWTKPAGAILVTVQAIGGGAGGASGARMASGTATSGGSGGGPAAYSEGLFPASALNATEQIIVPAGGAGGAAVTTDNTAGTAGGFGAFAQFGNSPIKLRANYAATVTSTGGSTGVAPGGGTGRGMLPGPQGGTGLVGAAGGQGGGAAAFPGSGSAGGGISATPAAFAGGAGAPALYQGDWTATAGASGGGAGGNGTAAATGTVVGGGGGAGGGSSITGAGGAGGNGALYGAGGGGGGSSLNGFASGKGGDGAQGIVVVTTWF